MRANLMSNSNGRSSAHQGHTPIPSTHNDRDSPKVKVAACSPVTNKRGSPIVRNGTWEDIAANRQSDPHVSKESDHVLREHAVDCPTQFQSQIAKKKKSGVRPRAFSELGMGPELMEVSFKAMIACSEQLCLCSVVAVAIQGLYLCYDNKVKIVHCVIVRWTNHKCRCGSSVCV